MKHVILRRPLSFVLAVFLLFSLLPPVQVWAADPVTVYIDPAAGLDTNDGTETAPVQTLAAAYEMLAAGGGTVVFLSDLTWTEEALFPACEYPVTITSKTGAEGIIASNSMRMQADTTFTNITLTFDNAAMMLISGEGHDLTIESDVTVVRNTANQVNLVAAPRRTPAVTANPTLTVKAGQWNYIYAAHGINITGDINVIVDGATCTYISPCYNATVTGNVNVTVKNSTVTTQYLEPSHADGKITGNLNVTLGDNANVNKVVGSSGTVQGAVTVTLDGTNQAVTTLTGIGATSSLVLRSGTYGGTATEFGSVAVDVAEGKTLSLKSALTADTVTCAGTLDFQAGGSLTATAVTGTVNCTLTGEVLVNKAFVTAPADADIVFPVDSGVVSENGKWMILDKENFKGLLVKAESDVTMVFYKDHDRQAADKIQPDYKETIDGITYYYFAGISGYYCYDASRSGDYTIYQRLYITAAERDAGHVEEVVMEKKANASLNEWDYKYYYGQVDEYIENSEENMDEKWHTEVPLVTPVFTNPDKPAHQMTTQEELHAFIEERDDPNDNMYVFSIGQSAKYKYEIPIVFFTKTDLSDCTTLEEVAAALEKDGLPNIGYKAQMHGDEHAAGEGALGVIDLLDKEENQSLLETINIYVMPRINPDGARECQRNLRSQSVLYSQFSSSTDPNRHMLTLGVHEARLYLRTVQLFDPVAELDGHERQRSSNIGDNQIGTSWRYGSGQEMLDLQVELVQSMFDALEAVDLSGAWYSDNVNTAPGNNTRSFAAAQSRIHLLMETRGIYMGNECYGSRTASHIVSAMAYLKYCAENVDTMASIVAAQRQALETAGKTYEEADTIILSSSRVAHAEYTQTTEKANFASGKISAYDQVPYIYEPYRTRVAPTAYVIPKDLPKIDEITELMELQEIDYYELPANTAISLQQYSGTVNSETNVTSNVTLSSEQQFAFPNGAYVFQMDQVNGYVLALLMEPDNGGFDLVEQTRIPQNEDGTFPIYRYITDLTDEEVGIAYTTAQAAPTGLSATNATAAANDGVITGLDATKLYEYKAGGADTYTQLPAGTTQITGLAPNTYYVRFQADENGVISMDAECVIGCKATVYLSAATGDDQNAGITEDAPVATLETAYAKLSSIFGSAGAASEGTIILLDDYTIASTKAAVNLPTHSWPLTILGKTASTKLIYDPGTTDSAAQQVFTFHGDTTLDNLTFHAASTARYDYICAAGNKVVFGEGVTTTSARSTIFPILVGGDYDSTIDGDVNLTVLGGTWYAIYATGYSASHRGTATLTVDGVTLKAGGIRTTYTGTPPGDTVIKLSNVKLTAALYCGTYSKGNISGDVTLILGENVTSSSGIYTGARSSGNMTGTVTIVADGADMSGLKLYNTPGSSNTSGAVAKGVLTYASGDAVLFDGFDEYHIDTSKGGTVTLTDDLTVDKIVGGGTVELAGHTLTGNPAPAADDESATEEALAVEGTLTVTDKETDDYNVDDDVYGKLVSITGDVVGGKDYVKINEESGVSFHKAKLDITTVTLRPTATGIYYTGAFTYDKAVEENAHYGITTSLYTAAPMVDDADENESRYTQDSGVGALIANIMEAGDDKNGDYANMPIYVRAYVQSGDDITYGETISVTLKQLVQAIDNKFDSLNETQQKALKDMYIAFSDVMAGWKIPNLINYAQ